MFKEAGVLFLYTETPLHAGSGASVAAVDLPIQRERHTQYPIIQASGVKGAIRDLAEELEKIREKEARLEEIKKLLEKNKINDKAKLEAEKKELEKSIQAIKIAFGPKERGDEHGGALSFTDARTLLFPVRSLAGVFAWVTCPAVLKRFKRDMEYLGEATKEGLKELLETISTVPDPEEDKAYIPKIQDKSKSIAVGGKVILEDVDFTAEEDSDQNGAVTKLANWLSTNVIPDSGDSYWCKKIKTSLVVLHDNAFKEFVQFSTEVITRIKIGEMGIVAEGPWNEENLPSETVLYSLALTMEPRAPDSEKENSGIKTPMNVLDFLKGKVIGQVDRVQFGGDETVGHGIVKIRFAKAEDLKKASKSG